MSVNQFNKSDNSLTMLASNQFGQGDLRTRVENLEENGVSITEISDKYSSTKSYAVGDYFISNDILYKVKVACIGVTPPDATYYDAVNVGSELKSIGNITNTMYGRGYSKPVSVYDNMVADLEASFISAPNYSTFIGQTSGGNEMGWYGFKHNANRVAGAICISPRSFGIAYGTRSVDGTWSFITLIK